MALLDTGNPLRVSAKWATKRINCTPAGIAAGCGGGCCTTAAYWPPKANGGVCIHLGLTGCTLTQHQKPVRCLIYPFVISATGMLVLHGRALTGCCKKNYKTELGGELTIIEALREPFTVLFGREQYERVLRDVTAGKDSYVLPSDRFEQHLVREDATEAANLNPEVVTKEYF